MTTKEKFWVDRYFYNTPTLICDDEGFDYTAIMSRFHYLLLKKDKSTYEEIVKYWAILIITAPDVFDSDEAEHFKNSVFSKVQDSAIKLNRPTEKIELLTEQPKLEPIDYFRRENWIRFLDDTYSSSKMNDLVVYRWYTDPANTLAARSYFGIYCLLLLRAYTREPSNTVQTLEDTVLCHGGSGKPPTAYAPNSRISFGQSTATFFRDAFRSQIATYRGIVWIVLDWNEHHISRNENCNGVRPCFFDRHVKPYLIYYGLSMVNFAATHLHNVEAWLQLKSVCEGRYSAELLLALDSFNTFEEHINGVRLQDGILLEQKPHLKGEKCSLWPYSRLFSSLYFVSVGDENSLELLAFCLGHNFHEKNSYEHSYNCFLANLTYDNKEAKDMILSGAKDKFDRGWRAGRAERGIYH